MGMDMKSISFFSINIYNVISFDIKFINRMLHKHQIQKIDLIISAGTIKHCIYYKSIMKHKRIKTL